MDTNLPHANNYLSLLEVNDAFQDFVYIDANLDEKIKDRWSDINVYRSAVSTALNKGLSDIVSQHAKPGLPIVEIGSGMGYSLSDEISCNVIKIQPNTENCHMLQNTTTQQIYQTDALQACERLLETGKKIWP